MLLNQFLKTYFPRVGQPDCGFGSRGGKWKEKEGWVPFTEPGSREEVHAIEGRMVEEGSFPTHFTPGPRLNGGPRDMSKCPSTLNLEMWPGSKKQNNKTKQQKKNHEFWPMWLRISRWAHPGWWTLNTMRKNRNLRYKDAHRRSWKDRSRLELRSHKPRSTRGCAASEGRRETWTDSRS